MNATGQLKAATNETWVIEVVHPEKP